MTHKYLYNSIASSTRNTYNAAYTSYEKFAKQNGIPLNLQLPITTSTMVLWIVWLADQSYRGLTFKTIKTYLSGIISISIELGHPDPVSNNTIVAQILRSVKRTIGVKPTFKRLPVTTGIIRSILKSVPDNIRQYLDRLLLAAICIGTFGLLRCGEFVQTNNDQDNELKLSQLSLLNQFGMPINIKTANNIQLSNTNYLSIHLNQSKADPYRKGADIEISNIIAVRILIDYIKLHPKRSSSNSVLFIHRNGDSLTRDELVNGTRKYLIHANIPNANDYHGHSFRKGGAQSLLEAGIDSETIQRLGRWASDSHLLYHQLTLPMRLAISQKM